jgi:ATP-binding cassette subfamily C protein
MASSPAALDRSTVRFLLDQLPRRRVAVLVLLMAGVSITEGFGVLALLPILGRLQAGGDGAAPAKHIVATIGFLPSVPMLLAVMIGLAVLRAALAYLRQVRASAIQHEVVDRLRTAAFDAVLHAEWRWLAHTRGSDHANLILTNVSRVGLGLNQLLNGAALSVAVAGYLVAAFLLSWRIAMLTIVLGALVLLLFGRHRRQAASFGFALGEASKALHAYVHQSFAGVRIIKAHGIEDQQTRGFGAVVAGVRAHAQRNERMNGRGQAAVQIGNAVAIALVLGIAHLHFHVSLQRLLPLLFAFARIAPMLGTIQTNWSTWMHMKPSVVEIRTFLADAAEIREPVAVARVPRKLRQAIVLRDVSVCYAGRQEPALQDISCTIPANTTTALCGTSGAGKSTLADLLMGLIAPDRGSVWVDGVLLDGASRIAWRDSVAYVQQDAFLFHDTIRANILLGRRLASQIVEAALHRAGAGFVFDLPEGLDTIVGDGGIRLSGGERQRIALARALVGSPSLLILDEATSALDPDHERMVRDTMRTLRGAVTLVFISHRPSMQEDADQVIVLARGRIQ